MKALMAEDDEGRARLEREDARIERKVMREAKKNAMEDPELREEQRRHEQDLKDAEMRVVGPEEFQIDTPNQKTMAQRIAQWENR